MLVGNYSGQTLKVSFARDHGVKTDVSCKSFPDFIEKSHSYLARKILPLREKQENLTAEIMEAAEFFRVFLSGICTLSWHGIEVVEECSPPQLIIGSMVLKSGESTVVKSSEVIMYECVDGPHNFAGHLKTNDPNNPDLVVNVNSEWDHNSRS